MTGAAEVVALILGLVDAALKVADALTSKLDPAEAATARQRLALSMFQRASRIDADEAAENAAVPQK